MCNGLKKPILDGAGLTRFQVVKLGRWMKNAKKVQGI